MRLLVAAAVTAGTLFVGAAPALGSPADEGNCISTSDNGGEAGTRNSSLAGPEFGPGVAAFLRGGWIGSVASSPDCRR